MIADVAQIEFVVKLDLLMCLVHVRKSCPRFETIRMILRI